ncbi:MAG TPA: hypothetical protein P5132_02985 [Bacteroidales bacterium]|nr:hypothetical protein [Bacteroidales bacterium]
MSKEVKQIETMGYIKKEEWLSDITNNIIQNTLVLESSHPFPGYHGENLPENACPRSLFLIIEKKHSFEDIARINKKISKTFTFDFNASQGTIHFKTGNYDCIRIKYLKSFTFLPELQNLYKQEGIVFSKHKKINDNAIIVINKNFCLKEVEDTVYQDKEEPTKFYIELPNQLSWEDFKHLTAYVKNNIDNSNFDAAQGVFYRKSGIADVIRLYIKEKEEQEVKQIHKLYLENINRKLI